MCLKAATPRPLRAALAILFVAAIGCTPDLPEPKSEAAQLYIRRCGGCHRLYPPNVMTAATWDAMLQRMQGEMRRRGFPPLDKIETRTLRAYLHRYALNSSKAE